MNQKLSDLVNTGRLPENGSKLIHISPIARLVPPLVFEYPRLGEVICQSAAGIYVKIDDAPYFCPHDRAGNLAVGDTTFFTSISYERNGLYVSYPKGVATIIQVAYAAKYSMDMAFRELNDCGRDRTILHPVAVSLLRYALSGQEAGLKVGFRRGSFKMIAGFIPASRFAPGTNLVELIGTELSVVVSVVSAGDATHVGYVEFSTI